MIEFQYIPHAIPLFVAAAVSIALAWYALRRRDQAEALTFGLMMLALSMWCLCFGLNMSGANLETSYFFNRIKYIGALAAPPLWLILTLQYTQQQSFLTRRNIILLFLPAIVLLPIILTNPLTEWWWTDVHKEPFGDLQALASGATTILHGVYTYVAYAYFVVGLWLYVRFYRHTERIYRSQTGLLIIATAIPLFAHLITQTLGISPLPAPWGGEMLFLALSGVLAWVAIFRYHFLDIMPVARQAIVEQVPEGVIVIDTAGRIVDANPAAQAMLNACAEPVVGQPLTAAADTPALRQALLEMVQRTESQPNERDVTLDEGHVLSLSVTPLTHRNSGVAGQIILLRDISERTAARQQLETLYRQTEIERERLALTIRTASDAIALLDADGQVLASNPSARQVLQAQHRDQFPLVLRDTLNRAQATSSVTKVQIKLGEQSFSVTAAPVAGTGLVLTMHDVTHFEQLARMKDEFVATVSHDLRTPLTAILGYAQIAQMVGYEEEREEALGQVEILVDQMTDLINDLLDLAKLEAGVTHTAIPVELGKLAHEAVDHLTGIARSKGISLHYESEPHPPLQADPRLIYQMWHNLIDNAIKYTPQGTIVVRVKSTNTQLIGQVADTGIGIPPTDIPYVFDKFFRVQNPAVREASGTGLGLSLVKRIIEEYGGQIWVESELGVGSTFTLAFPLSQ